MSRPHCVYCNLPPEAVVFLVGTRITEAWPARMPGFLDFPGGGGPDAGGYLDPEHAVPLTPAATEMRAEMLADPMALLREPQPDDNAHERYVHELRMAQWRELQRAKRG